MENFIDVKRRARLLEGCLLTAALAVAGAEAAAYALGVLQIWEAFAMTPLVPIIVTSVLFVDYELGHYEHIGRGRWVNNDRSKSLFMLLGGVVLMLGLAVSIASVSVDLNRVIFDTGSGASLMCAGIYVVKRFAW